MPCRDTSFLKRKTYALKILTQVLLFVLYCKISHTLFQSAYNNPVKTLSENIEYPAKQKKNNMLKEFFTLIFCVKST